MNKDVYLNNPTRCPNCGSLLISNHRDYWGEEGYISIAMKCDTCLQTWTEYYKLVNWEFDDD